MSKFIEVNGVDITDFIIKDGAGIRVPLDKVDMKDADPIVNVELTVNLKMPLSQYDKVFKKLVVT